MPNDLANSWSIGVEAVSTTGSLSVIQALASSKTGAVPTWSNVPGIASTAPKSMATTALATLLYYSKATA